MSGPLLSPNLELVIEARRLVQDGDASLLGQRSHLAPGLVSEIMGRNRDVVMLLTRYLESRGVTP